MRAGTQEGPANAESPWKRDSRTEARGCEEAQAELSSCASCPQSSSWSPSSSRAAISPARSRRSARRFRRGEKYQVLLGITGSGKTFTVANVIEQLQRPTLVIAHNKTLAAQLYGEFKELFPDNAVEYFVSYYDYYQPEAYVPSTDTYIEKDSIINDADRPHAPRGDVRAALAARRDHRRLGVAASTASARPRATTACSSSSRRGEELRRDELLRRLVEIQYERNDVDFHRGTFRVRGDVVEVFPAYEDETRHPHRVVRRRDRGDHARSIRCAARCCGKLDALRDLPRLALRHPEQQQLRARDRRRSATSCASGSTSYDKRGQAPRGAAARAAHDVRPRDARADGLLQRHRELLAPPLGPQRRASRRRR